MKPTTESIDDARRLTERMVQDVGFANVQLCVAKMAFECGSPNRARDVLQTARANLITLRRTQTAILGHIDDALASAEGGAR